MASDDRNEQTYIESIEQNGVRHFFDVNMMTDDEIAETIIQAKHRWDRLRGNEGSDSNERPKT